MKSPRISTILVSHFHRSTIERALRSLRLLGDDLVEVLVVDNGGDLGADLDQGIAGRPLRLLEPGENLGFAGGVNLAAQKTTGELLMLLISMENNTFKTVQLLEEVIKDDQE